MKKLLLFTIILLFISCNNDKVEKDNKENYLQELQKAKFYNDLADSTLADSVNASLGYALKAFEISKKNSLLQEQARSLILLCKVYKKNNENEKALEYSYQALEIRKILGDKKYIAQAYTNLGLIYFNLGQFEKAIENYKISDSIKTLLKDSTGMGIVATNIANIYAQTANYDKAIVYFQKALNIFEKVGHNEGKVSCLIGCGIVFSNLKNYAKTIEYYNKANDIVLKLDNKKQLADLQNNFGSLYFKTGDYNKALEYYKKSIDYRYQLNDKQGIASSLNNIGLVYKTRKELDKALDYFKQALDINEKISATYDISLNMNAIGSIYIEMHKYDQALSYINGSLKLSWKIQNKDLILQNYFSLSEIYEHLGQYAKAMSYYKSGVAYSDTIQNSKVQREINELQIKYETAKKEQDLQILSTQNEIQKLQLDRTKLISLSLASLVLIVVLIGFLIIRQNRLKMKHESLVLEQKLLRTQMNPHFIFNSLTSIQSFIFDDDKLTLGKYISDFASLMRLILENSREELISLDKEITTLRLYLELQKLRYENKFQYSITADPAFTPEFVSIPPMLGQPFVENSIKHGIEKKIGDGRIDIRFIKSNGSIILEIQDNGIGREMAMKLKEAEGKKHNSLALSITHDRIENFNKRNRRKMNFEIIDLIKNDKPEGTLVKFTIPIV